MRFRDRTDAGRRLARVLGRRELHSPMELGLPRGGVPVALEVALQLRATLEVLVYERFEQTSDDEVMELLAQASARAEART